MENLRQREVNQEQIALRAYEIWEASGRPVGRDQEHWLMAEAELRGQKRGDASRLASSSVTKETSAPTENAARGPRAAEIPETKLPRSARLRSGKGT